VIVNNIINIYDANSKNIWHTIFLSSGGSNMNISKKFNNSIGFLLVVSLTASANVAAEDILEEIIVTASKRGAQSVQDVAGGVRAFTGGFMEDHGLRTIEDIARLEPSLQFAKAAIGDLQPVIRGIQSPGAGTVGVYFDETVITGANFNDGGGRTPDIGAYDLARVEILKGPQGTLFGASSMSGTVRFISNKPDASGVDANLRVGGDALEDGDPGFGVDGMINIPITEDVFALRGAFWHESRGGFIDSYTGINAVTETKDADSVDKTGGRLMARFTPNAEFTLDAYVMYQELEVDGPAGFTPSPTGVGLPITLIQGPPFMIGLTAAPQAGVYGERQHTTPAAESNGNDILMYGFTAEYDLGFGSVTGTASNYENDNFYRTDTSAIATGFGLVDNAAVGLFFGTGLIRTSTGFLLPQTHDREVLSAELRFSSDFDGPLNFVAGGFYTEDDSKSQTLVVTSDSVTGETLCNSHSECIADPTSAAAQTIVFGTDFLADIEAFALFGHADYELTDAFTLSAGIRYYDSEEHDRFLTLQAFQGSAVFTFPPAFGGPVQTVPILGLDAKHKESEVTWDAGLSYQHTDDQLYYVKGASGFRQGGLNDSNAAAQLGVVIPTEFSPDTVKSVEVGAKTTWNDGRLVFNATYFKMFWDNIQVPGQDPTDTANFIDNATKAEIDGIELELFARPTDQLDLTFGLIWMDAALTADQALDNPLAPGDPIPPLGIDGDQIPKAAEWAYSGSAEYRTPFTLMDNVDLALRANFSYTGKSDRFFNNSFGGNREIGDYFLLNLNANFAYKNWDFRIFANNITDEVPTIDVSGAGLDAQNHLTVEPRSVGVQVQWNYK
jgi:outer membrane receptor protein involved in Fe transport